MKEDISRDRGKIHMEEGKREEKERYLVANS